MKVKHLTGFVEKIIGLSFKTKIKPVYFETRWGIHTFFVREPIDVIIVDDKFVVRKIVRCLKPRRIMFWNPIYKKVIEVPLNYVRYSKVKIGEKIMLYD